MLEGAVARLLNQLLGKYVVDLDTENLNVGIFSGQVQLTDLKLKPEALYELNLPVQVKSGTIGKIWLQIPWISLWKQPIVVNIEDILIVFEPIISNEPFDEEKYKRLIRAAKKKVLEDLKKNGQLLGGTSELTEHLISNLLNYVQLNINNIHIRYEDEFSYEKPIGAGLCIGSISADTTNSKWKSSKFDKNAEICYYLLKLEATSVYWNVNSILKKWDLPSQYYQWRNAMSSSFQNYSYNDENFDFVLNPMSMKVKFVINKGAQSIVNKMNVDMVVHDCSIRISKGQYNSMLYVADSMQRMSISRAFLPHRPKQTIKENRKIWWRYASYSVLEQRVKPYTWSRIRRLRENYRKYVETYEQILLNPNDTELKLDLQKYEDELSIINVVIARQQARLLVQDNITETNYWSMLPSQEKAVIYEKIGISDKDYPSQKIEIEHNYCFRMGHFSFMLAQDSKEILAVTLTQTIFSLEPKYVDKTYKIEFKVEGLILEGIGTEENLLPIISSEHNPDSPAYFLKVRFEKNKSSKCSYKLAIAMDSVEYIHNKPSLDEITAFLFKSEDSFNTVTNYLTEVPHKLANFTKRKLLENWEITANIKVPHLIIPNTDSYLNADHLLIIEFGRYSLSTQLFQQPSLMESTTPMELEERLYSKILVKCSDIQILFCNSRDNWRDAKKENDTDMHIISKAQFQSIFAVSVSEIKTFPRYKFHFTFPLMKLNISERRIGKILQFFSNPIMKRENTTNSVKSFFLRDRICDRHTSTELRHICDKIGIINNFSKYKRHKTESARQRMCKTAKSATHSQRYDMNEAYARCVDLPGLEDNISPNNNIHILFRIVMNEINVTFSRSSYYAEKEYLILRLGIFTMDVALLTFGPSYQISLNSILLTDKLHTSSNGQYLDLIHTAIRSKEDVFIVLFRRVSAGCPDFWSHFHGVETSLVANLGTINVLLHQEAICTLFQYSKYLNDKIGGQMAVFAQNHMYGILRKIGNVLHKPCDVPVPSGSVKFSHSTRLNDMTIRVCDSDFDIINIELSGLELDVLFRANERFVFRTFLANINIEHLSEITLYPKILYTDEDKVFEVKYVKNTANIGYHNDISPNIENVFGDGVFKFELGRLNVTFLYKLIVQLERFISNLNVLTVLEKLFTRICDFVSNIKNKLKPMNKINLAINVCGPVILIPQKSSSPNVIVIDTGHLKVENFFKDCSTEILENILLKLTGLTITRGVMTLTSTLEGQEILIDPVGLNMDIKCVSNLKTSMSSWEVDCIVDLIQITLGQRDLIIILSILSDNIGEGKLMDLLPNQTDEQTEHAELDDSMKTLEAFFCEPKLKRIVAKCNIEEIRITLFFDSAELLSSPIRDLNHGLCKLEILEIDSCITVYNDGSIDGKLSVEKTVMEEIGPNSSITDKFILQSPAEDSKNNNCNITVNKPPIIDITFHQNKTNHKSADVIIGPLVLSFSIPFCERLALFIIECLPKNSADKGIINLAYEAEASHNTSPGRKRSLTVSMRINKPELIFLVETTSNKKRYFITKTEILIDYSIHLHRKNFVLSLSGLQSLFYDLDEYSEDPYTILRQCDVELCESFSDESGEKITFAVSAIHLKMCTEVIHSLNDILNDIVEHFKLPTAEVINRNKANEGNIETTQDLWKPEKLNDFVDTFDDIEPKAQVARYRQILLIPKFDIVAKFEVERVQVLIIKSTIELTLHDWLSTLNCTCEITLQANYYNEYVQNWEPLIDPIVIDENEYKPWEMIIKVFQDKSQPMLSYNESDSKKKPSDNLKKRTSRSVTTTEDEDSGEDMMYLEPTTLMSNAGNRRVKTSLSTFLDESDSENEDGTMEKLAAAISDLFTGDWNENEDSEFGQTSEEEEDEDEEKFEDLNAKEVTSNYNSSFYILVDAKESLNWTVTPQSLKIISELITQYSNKIISVRINKKQLSLQNDIGPHTKVELYEVKNENPEEHRRICLKKFENDDSVPNSPNKSTFSMQEYLDNTFDDKDSIDEDSKDELEAIRDFETVSRLMFPSETTSNLYNRINKQFLKIYIPSYPPIQTTCSMRNWEKLIKVYSNNAAMTYYLAAKQTINKLERTITIRSPLQIKNETCFALSILYQPSILQQMNLEPLGDITNPFETTMRIAVLEAYEEYNVPLYIAYHCKLFIQPAYAEGHYASDSGIWWQDLATELDSAQDLQCRPKSGSNVEIFSLKVILRKNFEISSSSIQSVPNYVIHLLPPLVITNFLPYLLEVLNVSLNQVIKVEPGEKHSVYSSDFSKDQRLTIRVKHNSITWTGNLNLTKHLDEKSISLNSDSSEVHNMTVNVKADREGSCNLFFYAPYWIMNKTGLPLQIKGSASNNPENINEELSLFSFKRHGKQTVCIRIYESNWSSEMSLECAGTTGLVVCKNPERKKKYLLFLHTRLSNMCPKLTKVVTILPGFLITNNTDKALRFMEFNEKTDLWIDIAPSQTMIFWPETNSMEICVKHKDSKTPSYSFFIANQHKTVLRMDKGGAITVEVKGGVTSSFKIIFNEYKDGDAPVLVKNYCADLFLKIQQRDLSPVTLLNPYHSLLYTWDNPVRPRQLVWNVYNNKDPGFRVDITKDGYGEHKVRIHNVTPTTTIQESSSSDESEDSENFPNNFKRNVRRDKINIYWLCYKDGLQRTLLLTQDLRIYKSALKIFQEWCNVELLIALSGVGVSIFTSDKDRKEHVHAMLSDSPATWEVSVGRKWKTLTLELASWIEDKYRLHYKKCQLRDYIHIDFEKMYMIKPFFAELRRIYHPAVYVHLRKSVNYQYCNIRMQFIQIDNKQSGTIVLQPSPVPNIKDTSPFFEILLFKSTFNNSNIYKCIKLKVGNVHFNIEYSFFLKLCDLIEKNSKIYDPSLFYFDDIKSIHRSITSTDKKCLVESSQVVIEQLTLTSFGIQFNISNNAIVSPGGRRHPFISFLDYIFPLNMSPYMPVQGVHHKISSIEYLDFCESFQTAMLAVTDQVTTQFLQQYYSHVLGIQVLVNTFAIQPAIEIGEFDFEETGSILLRSYRCLLGHINMSPAAVEACVTDIFYNQNIENIQRIRRHGSFHKSDITPKSITISSRNFLTGVPNALNQLIVKNQNGMNFDGEMFFRTTGKALLSLITRHPDEKSDSVEVASEALKRASILGEPIKLHQRLTRFQNKYLGLKPLSNYESMGYYLLENIGNSRFANDNYWAHAAVDRIGKTIIIVSLQHIIKINKYRLWGPWEIEWAINLEDVISLPKIKNSELILHLKQTEKSTEHSRQIMLIGQHEILVWLHNKIEQAIIVSTEEKSWLSP